MKYIEKKPSPSFFEEWKQQFHDVHGFAPAYKDFRETDEWVELRNILLNEQGEICCYCMQTITSLNSHIEHFVPRSTKRQYPHSKIANDIELNYENMFLSCNGDNGDKSHCGRVKDNIVPLMLVSPSDPTVEDLFTYQLDGTICGDSQKAMETIEIMQLNTLKLRRHRERAIYLSGITDEDFELEKQQYIQKYLNRKADNSYYPFCMAIVFCMRHI